MINGDKKNFLEQAARSFLPKPFTHKGANGNSGRSSKADRKMTARQESILIVDDEKVIRGLLNRKLSEKDYECQEAGDAGQALEQLSNNAFGLVILDNKMPGKSGIELLPEIVTGYPDTAVIMATATTDISIAIECMKQGAYDYITKPFNLEEVVLSVNRALEKRRLVLENNEYHHHLEDIVAEQTIKIRALYLSSITALVNALEAKDEYTSGHSQRVSDIAVTIAKEMKLSPEFIDTLRVAGLVHDVGKIGVRELVLNKPSLLTEEELQHTQRHPGIGEHILIPIAGDEEILKLVRGHHEHYDGTGYPDGLKGSQIPLGARILAVADAYEAMTSARPYREMLSEREALAELERCKGTQLDPGIVDAFFHSNVVGFLNSGKAVK